MFKFLCLAVLAVSLSHVTAKISKDSELALAMHLGMHVDECGKELNQNVDTIKEQYKTTGKFDGVDKCFIACVLKKAGSINAEGKFDIDKELEEVRKIVKNDDDYKSMESVSKVCLSVNDEVVSDGNKGCERAYLLLTCLRKNREE